MNRIIDKLECKSSCGIDEIRSSYRICGSLCICSIKSHFVANVMLGLKITSPIVNKLLGIIT